MTLPELPEPFGLLAYELNGYTADQMHAYARAALAQTGAEPVACVTECEACFTPDACQLRGTCDHYAASQLRIAPTAQPAPLPAAKSDAYDMIDRFLRNSLDDDIYAEYSAAMDRLISAPLPAREPQPLTDERIERLANLARRSAKQLTKWAEWYGGADRVARGQLAIPPSGDVELLEDLTAAIAAPSAPDIAGSAFSRMQADKAAKDAANIEAGRCPECDGDGQQGGQFCGGFWTCEACSGTGITATPAAKEHP